MVWLTPTSSVVRWRSASALMSQRPPRGRIREREPVAVAEHGAHRFAPTSAEIGQNVLAERVGEIHLAGEHVQLVDEDLEVDLHGVADIPAGIDAIEQRFATRIRDLACRAFWPDSSQPRLCELPRSRGLSFQRRPREFRVEQSASRSLPCLRVDHRRSKGGRHVREWPLPDLASDSPFIFD